MADKPTVEDVRLWALGVPKAEQHIHDVGAMPVSLLQELAKKYDHPLPEGVDRNGYDFTGKGLPGFVAIYVAACAVVRTGDDYRELGKAISLNLRAQNVLYGRVHHTPAIPGARDGMWNEGLEGLLEGFEEGLMRGGAFCHALIDIPAEFDAFYPGNDFRERTLEVALTHKYTDVNKPGVVAIGAAGDESKTNWSSYKAMLGTGREEGLDVAVHAGESQGLPGMYEAMNLLDQPPDRIEHGLAAVLDESLCADLKAAGVTLDVAISSNHVLDNLTEVGLSQHPFLELDARGVPVSLNTDDPAMFRSDMCNEFAVAHALGADVETLCRFATAGWKDRFTPQGLREAALETIGSLAGGSIDDASPSQAQIDEYLDFAGSNATTSVVAHDRPQAP